MEYVYGLSFLHDAYLKWAGAIGITKFNRIIEFVGVIIIVFSCIFY